MKIHYKKFAKQSAIHFFYSNNTVEILLHKITKNINPACIFSVHGRFASIFVTAGRLQLLALEFTPVGLHKPKMLVIQLHTSGVRKNACHTIFIQFLKMVEK